MRQSVKKGKFSLVGNNGWAGQPVVSRTRVSAGATDGDVNRVYVNRGMFASFNYRGNKDRDKVIFGGQAGAITKRANSVIDFGNDRVRDVFVFTNTTREHGPFNHMQRFVIKNFGREDVVRLRNINKTFRFNDLRSYGNGVYGFNGVPLDKLRVTLASGLS
ncbi:hypothetical protein [Cyanobium sp. NIES-981]|uniref:hypothetical protein n=1 Tax=Cyanobium sp. NIES-981 TaxID=1851505 RepID=UPI0007DD73E2|nr:hypothetical protein [Cyanobium sp. NIES-981]SBO41742.1 conserved protein of unknown function [Cyanobium sp. NIES-981]